jgi:hypothetical protein
MKTIHLLMLTGLLALATLVGGCVVHEHGYHHHPVAHVHGPGCGHEFRGGVWVTVPVIEVR